MKSSYELARTNECTTAASTRISTRAALRRQPVRPPVGLQTKTNGIRNPSLDSAKFVMIFLVVFGHIIEPVVGESSLLKTIYMSIYSFHMPVFIIMSGMFTTSACSKADIMNIVSTLLIPFITFTVLYETFHFLVQGELSSYTVNLKPYWILWFLYSSFLWKLFLPVSLRFRYPIIVSIVVAVAVGHIDSVGYFLGVSRTLYFFPFFLMGHFLASSVSTDALFGKIPKPIFLVLLLLNPLIFWLFNELPHQWLLGSFSYSRLETGGLLGPMIRSAIYLISIVKAFVILQLMPTGELYISRKGQNSMYVYVWHGFVVKFVYGIGFLRLMGQMSPWFVLLLSFVLALMITLALSTDLVAKNTERFVLHPARFLMLQKS